MKPYNFEINNYSTKDRVQPWENVDIFWCRSLNNRWKVNNRWFVIGCICTEKSIPNFTKSIVHMIALVKTACMTPHKICSQFFCLELNNFFCALNNLWTCDKLVKLKESKDDKTHFKISHNRKKNTHCFQCRFCLFGSTGFKWI